MKKYALFSLSVAASVLLAATSARAGNIYIPAQNFEFGNDATDCTKIHAQGATYDHQVRRCPDAGSNGVVMYAEGVFFPSDAGNDWSYYVVESTPDGTGGEICAWDVRTMALDPLCDPTTAMAGTVANADVTTEVALPDVMLYSNLTAATAVYSCANSADCTGDACDATMVRIEVKLDRANTSASSCDFRGLAITY